MKACHLSLRHKNPAALTRTLAVAAMTAFFAAGHADARYQTMFKDPAVFFFPFSAPGITMTHHSGRRHMSRRTDIKVLIALAALGLAVSVFAQEADKKPQPPKLSVQVNNAAVRETPSFLSPVSAALNYGDTVGVLEETGGWQKVQPESSPVVGWMHASALTKQQINLHAGETDADVKASQQELTAGGRGYDEAIERAFRKDHKELEASYQQLDRLLADPAGRASLSEAVRFMRGGELSARAGGGQ